MKNKKVPSDRLTPLKTSPCHVIYQVLPKVSSSAPEQENHPSKCLPDVQQARHGKKKSVMDTVMSQQVLLVEMKFYILLNLNRSDQGPGSSLVQLSLQKSAIQSRSFKIPGVLGAGEKRCGLEFFLVVVLQSKS